MPPMNGGEGVCMFESAELGHRISGREYDKAVPKLREALLKVQYDLLADKSFPVIIIIMGLKPTGLISEKSSERV